MRRNRSYDYIVVGAGSAGCVLANRLSADPDRSVLLIEAGGKDRNPLFRLPMLMGKLFHSGIYNWRYHTEPVPSLDGRSLYWPRGKVLGGSSTINGMIYVRGNRDDYDRWAQMGLARLVLRQGSAGLSSFGRAPVERDGAYHGTCWRAYGLPRARRQPALRRVRRGGPPGRVIPSTTTSTAPTSKQGFGRYDFTIRRGKRCSASTAFLDPIPKSAQS